VYDDFSWIDSLKAVCQCGYEKNIPANIIEINIDGKYIKLLDKNILGQ
jgi:hypothetical protein